MKKNNTGKFFLKVVVCSHKKKWNNESWRDISESLFSIFLYFDGGLISIFPVFIPHIVSRTSTFCSTTSSLTIYVNFIQFIKTFFLPCLFLRGGDVKMWISTAMCAEVDACWGELINGVIVQNFRLLIYMQNQSHTHPPLADVDVNKI